MKKIFLLGFVAVLFGPVFVHAQAAFNSVLLGTGGAMSFSVNGISIEVVNSIIPTVATATVGSTSFDLDIITPSVIILKAPNLNQISVSASGGTDYTLDSVCNGGLSQVEISGGTATTTFTITPSSTLCTTSGGGGAGGAAPTTSGGGGGGGGGGGAVVSTPAPAAAPAAPSASGNATLIAQLQAQLQALLAQVAALTGGATPNANAYLNANANASFKRNLQTGSTGSDVKSLQAYLNSHGFPVAASGPGSPGNETTRFGALTRAALAKFQASAGISPSVGYFGLKTRAYIAAHP